jgi:DNA/RNA-binding protein KIN17
MGKEKGGFLTPKAIANRIKAKGLQKLRWYCQMCHKQCRDENGFKCHLMSESHQRQLLLVAETPDKFVDSFSREFSETFLELVRRRFGTKRVHANVVYQEYISDRNHTHMNSTQWETLTEYVKWLGREGHCVVDETEKGWFIAYVDRDPEAIRRMEATQRKEKMDMDDDERRAQFIHAQVERAKSQASADAGKTEYTKLERSVDAEKIAIKLMPAPSEGASKGASVTLQRNVLKLEAEKAAEKLRKDDSASVISAVSSRSSVSGTKRKSALEDIMEMEEQSKEKRGRKDHWLHEGIVVKVVAKKLGDAYYKRKGVVREVIDHYGAVVQMLEGRERVKVDQEHLETVLPGIDKPVLVVNGAYRGERAVLTGINETAFSCSVRLEVGPLKGRVVNGVRYEDVCKLNV